MIYHIQNPAHLTHRVKSPTGGSLVTNVSWHPTLVRILTVLHDDGTVKVWDLKQTTKELFRLQHGDNTRNISWSWCKHDFNVLMTSGEDKKGVLWRVNEGKAIHEITFDEHYLHIAWNPLRPGYLAGSSYDGDVSIYEINFAGPQACPPWLGRKCGATLGFGGKLFSFGQEFGDLVKPSSNRDGKKPKKIHAQYLPVQSSMLERAQEFQQILKTLKSPQDLQSFAEHKNAKDGTIEAQTWEMIQLFYDKDYRDKMLAYLGFAPLADTAQPSPFL
ncbi:hypothetical protein RFI_09001 [Reticulomyxa filosa]|uniref:Uncharacterized protein n=1 Tax=Reticulomyxa filosa TaxID=46433 RepID=X6NQ29_RETFI|nr:hypothetical protein RFI_09001 [Reticulomyxa filosa]|eukprot:ETO28131.1 hypothetical protein RFI_09001 [Reticulomyxa filosa]